MCPQGKVSLLSREGVRELQYFIFHLAVCHVVSCILTFGLGMAKVTNLSFNISFSPSPSFLHQVKALIKVRNIYKLGHTFNTNMT